jgi:signal transduction histidine kinase
MIRPFDSSVAQRLEDQLRSGSSDTFWTSELMIEQSDTEQAVKRYFELTLSSVRMEDVRDGFLGVFDIPELRKFVFWVRDVTLRKERERFQRDLLSTTTHDLKGPLGAILTSAELMSEAGLDEKINHTELVLRIASCARSSITLIDELLSARRIQDGVLIVRPQRFAVHEVLEDVVLDFYPVARAREIDFSAKAVDPELEVYADKIGIHRVLGNLVSNAIKFGGPEGKVRLSAKRKDNTVQIMVSDTGPGINPQERAQLFERYQRLEKHDEVEGTGLGLFVAKNIVDAHGGRIDVQSRVGHGTTFIVSFPDEVEQKVARE